MSEIISQLNVNIEKAKEMFDNLDVAENTVKEYKVRITPFLAFIEQRGVHANTFLDYKKKLANRTDYAVSTKNKYLTTARIFIKEASRLGLITRDITQNVKSFSQSKKHKRQGLNQAEIDILTKHLQSLTNNEKNTRLKALFSLLVFQGLRQIEITRIVISDLCLVDKTVFILGKNRQDKESIFLHPETVKNIELYLAVNKISDGYLFPSKSNKNLNKQMSTRGLRQIIKDVLDILEINKHVHGFRNYFTSKLIKSYGGDLLEVARYTRHRSLEMLQVYNDNIKHKQDLPRYYKVFKDISL